MRFGWLLSPLSLINCHWNWQNKVWASHRAGERVRPDTSCEFAGVGQAEEYGTLGDSVSCPKNCSLQNMTIFDLQNSSCLSDNLCPFPLIPVPCPTDHVPVAKHKPPPAQWILTGWAVDSRRRNFEGGIKLRFRSDFRSSLPGMA